MDVIDRFYIDSTGRIRLNEYRIVVRDYFGIDKQTYTDSEYFVTAASASEWENNVIPKHKLLELITKEELDNSAYTWMDGILLRTSEHAKEIAEIASYGSIEAYEASLPESEDAFRLDTDYRISKLELGL